MKEVQNCESSLAEFSFAHGISIDELEKSENLITVENLDSFLVVYERNKGNYHDLPEQWCKFIKKYEHLSSADTIYIAEKYISEEKADSLLLGCTELPLAIKFCDVSVPTCILYGGKDYLTSRETISEFADRIGANLTVMENGEHWFHTEKQMKVLDNWVCSSIR